MMYYTGFADEAADGIDGQIAALQELGWSHIELRAVNGRNITDISDADFEEVVSKLGTAGIRVNAFGSTIANWGKSILDPFDQDLAEIERAIPRMKALGTRDIRIMSYAVLRDRKPTDQMLKERVERLKRITGMFADEGLRALHENCANYGGMGWPFTLELVDKVPGLKLIFDTANPATTLDRSKAEPFPPQSAWEFYENVKEFVEHVHIKDGIFKGNNPESVFEDADYVWPGEGNGDVKPIIADLLQNGYGGGLSIEPHLSVVFHDDSVSSSEQARTDSFVEYGKRLEALVGDLQG